jgi:hypothetical protein
MCIAATYGLTIMYLLVKRTSVLDKIIGVLGLGSAIFIFYSAILQLI